MNFRKPAEPWKSVPDNPLGYLHASAKNAQAAGQNELLARSIYPKRVLVVWKFFF